MREIVLDVETTGTNPLKGDKIVEIAAIELYNLIPTGNNFQAYINPERDSEADALRVHNLTTQFLSDKPLFKQIVPEFLVFIKDSPLVIHNAPFDMGFIQTELKNAGFPLLSNPVVDTLVLARQKFIGTSNSLDSLCKRFGIDISNRTIHAALLDVELLAKVYLELKGGKQTSLNIIRGSEANNPLTNQTTKAFRPPRPHAPSPDELSTHQQTFAGGYMWAWKDDLYTLPLEEFMQKHNLQKFMPAFLQGEYDEFRAFAEPILRGNGKQAENHIFYTLEAAIRKHQKQDLVDIIDAIKLKIKKEKTEKTK